MGYLLKELSLLQNQKQSFQQILLLNFMTQISDEKIELMVYERGVGLTQACGSGACATYASVTRHQQNTQPMIISQPGGELTLDYTNHTLTMTGPACCVCTGGVDLRMSGHDPLRPAVRPVRVGADDTCVNAKLRNLSPEQHKQPAMHKRTVW